MANVHTFDLGDIKKLFGGLPEDLMDDIGQSIIQSQSERIRVDSLTRDGQTLDPNSAGWEQTKLDGGGEKPVRPLVHSGEMMRYNSWNRKAEKNKIVIELATEHQEKLDNIDDIVSQTGRNWLEAYGIGSRELRLIVKILNKWTKTQLGIENPPEQFDESLGGNT